LIIFEKKYIISKNENIKTALKKATIFNFFREPVVGVNRWKAKSFHFWSCRW